MKLRNPTKSDSTDRLSRLRAGIALLADARAYAEEQQAGLWEFAVPLDELRTDGATTSDIRWLVSNGYAEHADETTRSNDRTRTFRQVRNLSFAKNACFLLTDSGVAFATAVTGDPTPLPTLKLVRCDEPEPAGSADSPRWDKQRRELRVGGSVVKRFRNRSPNQEAILTAFEEESWPRRIDDPLRPQAEMDSKCRLHDTIKCLNRHHLDRAILFHGDGTGQGVCWEYSDDAVETLPAAKPKKYRLAA